MVTFVGTQDNFLEALKDLLELDYAALEAYEAAIDRLETPAYREKFVEFRDDHEQHIEQLSTLLKKNNQEAPKNGSVGKQIVTTGKVILANIMGDNTVLKAVKSNEIDMNKAYERMIVHQGRWPDAEDILKKGLGDEKRHMLWLKKTIS